jgi:predicted enzyme related to lactoylglutathione lyase
MREASMSRNGQIDYLEMAGGDLSGTKAFYAEAFGWTFTDYGPTYAAFDQGLNGGFDADSAHASPPLPVLFADDLEAMRDRVLAAGGRISREIFDFPGGRRFHFSDPAGNELAVWSDH